MPTQSRKTILLATDRQRSVLNALQANRPHPIAYAPYGHRSLENGLLGFNGELPDPLTGHYHLGNGYRLFNTMLMRFNSPDSWAPFGKGGLNLYAYCGGDPVNRMDESGHSFATLLKAVVMFRRPLFKMRNSHNMPGTSSTSQLAQNTSPTAPMRNPPVVLTPSSATATVPLSPKSQHKANRLMARHGGRQQTFHQEAVAMQAAVDQPPTFHTVQNLPPPSYSEAIERMDPSDSNYALAMRNAASGLEPGPIRDPQRYPTGNSRHRGRD